MAPLVKTNGTPPGQHWLRGLGNPTPASDISPKDFDYACAITSGAEMGANPKGSEEQSAGLRTFPLVAIASCGLVQTAISLFGANATVNANIMQGVVTGIGFIGAGAIIRQGDFTTGHATAASIWTVGIMGAAVGYGYYDIGIILTVANLAVLMLRIRSWGG